MAFVIWISARMFIDKSYVTVLFLIYRIIGFTPAEASQVQWTVVYFGTTCLDAIFRCCHVVVNMPATYYITIDIDIGCGGKSTLDSFINIINAN